LRDLREAAHAGRRAFLRSLARFPHRHPFLIAGGALGLIAVFGILGYYKTNREVTRVNRSVTRIEAATPCLTYGSKSRLCKESFEQAVLTITHAEACAILRKAGLAIEPCAHARLRQEIRRGRERARTSRPTRGGDAVHTPAKGHQQPTPSPGGGGGAGKGGSGGGAPGGSTGPEEGHPEGHPEGQNSAPNSPQASSEAESAAASGDTKADIPADIPATVEATGHAAREVVGKTGEAVQGTVEGAGEAAGCVVRGSC
jgi:hypothetical protein